jgi:hypothetical protein
MKAKHKVNAVAPRLSDEDPDPLEQDDSEGATMQVSEGWLPWTFEDMIDIKKLINTRMELKQKEVLTAFLAGLNHSDIMVTEKHWRYHFAKGVEFLKGELGL